MTPAKQLRSQSLVGLTALMAFLSACGEDGEGNDSLWTGLSGFIVVIIVVVIIMKMVKK